MGAITYAKAGGPPDDWCGLKVFDLDTGEEVTEVDEVNAAEGWLVRAKTDENGNIFLDETGLEIGRERLSGHFEIRRP